MSTVPSQRQRSTPGLRLALVALAALALFGALKLRNGCGSAPPVAKPGGDGAGGAAPAVTYRCNPAAQTGCPAGQKCDLFCGPSGTQFGCRAAEGTLAIGQPCRESTTTGPETCVQGAACLASLRGTFCTAFCDDSVACGSGRCVERTALFRCPPDPRKAKPFAMRICQ